MNIHFIAIGGAVMHNIAIALHKKGIHVTGSDDVIYEPSAGRLAKYNLLPPNGWNVDNIKPNLNAVILGMHAQPDNTELIRAQELGLKIYSYPEYIYEQSKDKLRVVVGGSHGKTTVTSMILHVLNYYNKPFDYLVGAQSAGFDTMCQLTDAPVMIIEGDEYLASPIDKRPKFHLYKANIGVITGIAWDHINVFPTFENYVSQFAQFMDTITPNGKVIYCESDKNLNEVVNQSVAPVKKIPYGIPAYQITDGVTCLMPRHIPLKVFGDHNLMNLNAAKLVCNELKISENEFNKAISSFTGAEKRLELIKSINQTNVYKDFAHSPSKLKATVKAVKSQFSDRKLVAMIELHTFSSLNKTFLKEYKNMMKEVDLPIVYIAGKTLVEKKMQPLTEADIKESFNDNRIFYFNDPAKLEIFLRKQDYRRTNLLLMSSGTYGGINLQKLADELHT